MANVVTIIIGAETLELVSDIYALSRISSPSVKHQMTRSNAVPYAEGENTVTSTFLDAEATFEVLVKGDAADDVDNAVEDLNRVLQRVQEWAVNKLGSPGRLFIHRHNSTFGGYRVITGVSTFPEALDLGSEDWLLASSINNIIKVRFSLFLEPLAHAGTIQHVLTTGWQNGPELTADWSAVPTVPGSMPAGVRVRMENTGNLPWAEVWLALLQADPIIYERSGSFDPTASGLNYRAITGIDEDWSTILEWESGDPDWVPVGDAPVRGFIRCRCTDYVPQRLQLRFGCSIGTSSLIQYGPAIGHPLVANPLGPAEWALIDLGTLWPPAGLSARSLQGAVTGRFWVEAYTEDPLEADSLDVDYLQVVTFESLTKLVGGVEVGETLVYDAISQDSAFYWKSRFPQAYITDTTTSALVKQSNRYGKLNSLQPGDGGRIWAQAFQEGNIHNVTIDVEGNLVVQVLPTYALGLRGTF